MDRVLITGGAAGIGAAIAEACRDAGWEPVVLDREGPGIRADLSRPEDAARALEAALEGGPITRLVNNVGMVAPKPLEAQTLAEFDAVMQLNLRCAMQCAQAGQQFFGFEWFGKVIICTCIQPFGAVAGPAQSRQDQDGCSNTALAQPFRDSQPINIAQHPIKDDDIKALHSCAQ